MGRSMDKESSSSSFGASGEVLSCPETNEVITWIRPFEESWADAFWKRFSFPPYVCASFSSLGPQFVACNDGDRGVMNFIYWLEIHINEGLRFPLLLLIHQFLYFTQLHPNHVHMNIVHVLLGVSVLNRKHRLHLGLEEVLFAFTFKRHNLVKYYLVVNAKSLQLVTSLPSTNKNKPQGNVLLFKA